MSEVEFGLTTWNEHVDTGVPNRKEERARWDDILKLHEGENPMRILTKPYKYLIHKYKPHPKAPGFPDKIKCSMPVHGKCAICEMLDKDGNMRFPRIARYYAGVIDRETQSYKVLDVSPTLYQRLKDYVNNAKWGDLSQYDVTVVVNSSKGSAGYYSVIPDPKEPLSKEDLAIKDKDADIEDLLRKCNPLPPDWVAKRVAFVNARSGVAAQPDNGSSGGGNGETSFPPDVEESNDDHEFPPA